VLPRQEDKGGNSSIKVHVWDTASQEWFRALAGMHYRDTQFALIVYASNDCESFYEV
jgi:GTPase SAR1 family protein